METLEVIFYISAHQEYFEYKYEYIPANSLHNVKIPFVIFACIE